MKSEETKWHIIIDGQGAPEDSDPVAAIWVQGTETYAGLAYRDTETKRWYLLNEDSGEPLREPDYWIEIPSISL